MGRDKLSVAVVGLGFGGGFPAIYLAHPGVDRVAICERDPRRLAAVCERYEFADQFSDLAEVLASDYDAVHLVTGIPDHAAQTLAVLESGKHCACTVPMATSLDDLAAIVAAQRRSGRQYMMMETAVYTRQYLHAAELHRGGQFGRLQFLRGAHYQDMEHWPPYWLGLPPMWYATHAVAPLLALAESRAVRVRALGSGTMREELRAVYGNPYPIETALFELATPGLAAEVTRSLFACARPYMESFVVYGEDACYEWQMEHEPPVLFEASPIVPRQVRQFTTTRPAAPDRPDLLPPEVAPYTTRFKTTSRHTHLSFEHGGGHHGSHPHLVHEFVTACLQDRPPAIDAVTAAQWTAAGLCAHESALRGGEAVEVPGFG
ncbi:MAG: Gfo/Idh/MocA family oxidoreductase [Fimbriimonadaceae bacterium]|nr:Gfo/Idh/MocA family oxidoreductase [Fimbriimonadaceae bacterium]